ncbi:MAG: beta-galactosidase [Oscillospiraceae bacterium]|jgi:hypothetical protein|nr:beta-galactosidase [Oscillospiraceae bacterium]
MKWWLDYPWRMIQTNLREIDMADMDASAYVQALKEFDATVAMINTSGIIASYKTDLDFQYQSRFLTGDSLADVIAACHEAGIRVIARTDFSKVRQPIYEKYPQWAFRDQEGGIVNYNGDVHVCVCSDYQQDYALRIMRETVEKLDINGMFFNMGGFVQRDYSNHYNGFCHCEKCKEKFRAFAQMDLPKSSRLDDPAYRAYRLFQQKVVKEQNKTVYKLLTGLKPSLCISRVGDEGFFRQEANTALDRPLPRWQYDAADNTKYVRSSFGPGMISSNTSVDFIDYPARHTAVSPHQQSMRLAQSLAQGGALDYYLIGRLDNHKDRSGYAGVRELFQFHKKYEAVFKNDLKSKARIALVRDADGNQQEYRGWYRFLAENHFLFDAPLKNAVTEEMLEKYAAVILPDCPYISDDLGRLFDDFVHAGGKLIGVFESGMGDAAYAPRNQPVLRSLGIDRIEYIRHDMRGSYFEFEKGAFPSLPETELIYLDDGYVYADYNTGARRIMSLTPPQMFGPPERCYPTVFTNHPGAALNRFGKGEALYIPWKPGSFYYTQGYAVYLAWAKDILGSILKLEPVNGSLPEMVEVTHLESESGGFELVSLLNNSGHFGLSFFRPVPIQPVRLTVRTDRTVKSVYSLKLEKELEFSRDQDALTVLLPVLEQYDAIKINI